MPKPLQNVDLLSAFNKGERERIVNILQDKQFPQKRLLNPSEFETLLRSRGLHIGYESLQTWVYRVLCGLRSSLPRKKRMAILNAANRRNPRARALINWIWAFSPSATALLVR